MGYGISNVWPEWFMRLYQRWERRGRMQHPDVERVSEPDEEQSLTFRQELEQLVNKHSRENGCNTPDFILAQYMHDSLEAFDRAVTAREKWYGRKNEGPHVHEADDEG